MSNLLVAISAIWAEVTFNELFQKSMNGSQSTIFLKPLPVDWSRTKLCPVNESSQSSEPAIQSKLSQECNSLASSHECETEGNINPLAHCLPIRPGRIWLVVYLSAVAYKHIAILLKCYSITWLEILNIIYLHAIHHQAILAALALQQHDSDSTIHLTPLNQSELKSLANHPL